MRRVLRGVLLKDLLKQDLPPCRTRRRVRLEQVLMARTTPDPRTSVPHPPLRQSAIGNPPPGFQIKFLPVVAMALKQGELLGRSSSLFINTTQGVRKAQVVGVTWGKTVEEEDGEER